MANNGEMTVVEAGSVMETMWDETIEGMTILAGVKVPVITIQIMLAALCQDRISTARARFGAQMDRFYVRRDLESAKVQNNEARIRDLEAKVEELSAELIEAEKRLDYDRAEMVRINQAIVASKLAA